MINDQEFLQGAAFSRLFSYGCQIMISHMVSIHTSMYLIETNSSKSAVLFKISKKPKSAWSFTLSSKEQIALNALSSKFPCISLFIAFICHRDGICCISQEHLWNVLDRESSIVDHHISISRQLNGSYRVAGSSGQRMNQTVPQSNWPRVVLLK
ncbi:hypothetical protein B7486_40680 [cyanobacterium TDX16]|nr:hypothetical protein B7486_40680 [cyanobacterium TDX16]